MTAEEARARFAAARVARLATADGVGRPHLVPITFAVVGDSTVVSAVDHKPKRTTALKRLANIEVNPRVAVLVDEYGEDWSRLWWARADGAARVLPDVSPDAVRALASRYAPYRSHPPAGPFVVVEVERWSGWSAAG